MNSESPKRTLKEQTHDRDGPCRAILSHFKGMTSLQEKQTGYHAARGPGLDNSFVSEKMRI